MSASIARNCWHIICTSAVSQSSSVASSHKYHQLMKFKDIKSVSVNRQKCLSLMSWFSIQCVMQHNQQTVKNWRRLEIERAKPVTSGQN